MSVALPCPKCSGALVRGQHVDRDTCGSTPYPTVRLNPKGTESLSEIMDNLLKVMRP